MYLKKEPDDTAALFYYAVVLLELDLEDDAYGILKRTHAINPADVYVITNLALIILYKKKRPKVALRLLKKAASIHNKGILLHLSLDYLLQLTKFIK